MITSNRGIAFHFHHDTLAEWCSDYNRRIGEIKQFKLKAEQSLRLRLFKLIPNDRLPSKLKTAYEIYDQAEKAFIGAGEAYDRAWKAYDKAEKARERAGKAQERAGKARERTWEACDKVWKDWEKAREDWEKTWETYMPLLKKLHEELCLDCPWDGHTIFTRKNEAGEWY